MAFSARFGARQRVELVGVVGCGCRRRLQHAGAALIIRIRRRGVVEARCEHAVEIVPHVAPAAGLDEIAIGVVGIGCCSNVCVGHNALEAERAPDYRK